MDLIALIVIALGGYLLYGYMKAYEKLSTEIQNVRVAVDNLKADKPVPISGGTPVATTPASQLRQTFMNILKQMT